MKIPIITATPASLFGSQVDYQINTLYHFNASSFGEKDVLQLQEISAMGFSFTKKAERIILSS